MYKRLHLVEHSNCITDVILAVVLSGLALKLQSLGNLNAFIDTWEIYFWSMALATLIGGFGHLFSYYLDKKMLVVSWLLVIWATFYLEKHMLNTIFNSPFIIALIFAKSLILSLWTLKVRLFFPTTLSLIIGMAGIVCSSLFYKYLETGDFAYLMIIMAILSSSLAGWVRAKQINLATWFDANDLAHVISAVSFIGVYYGVKNIL